MQCPALQELRDEMFGALYRILNEQNNSFSLEDGDMLYYLGKSLTCLNDTEQIQFWQTAGYWVHKMYKKVILAKTGIG